MTKRKKSIIALVIGIILIIAAVLVACFANNMFAPKTPTYMQEIPEDGIIEEVSGNTIGYSENADIYSPLHQDNPEYISDELPYMKTGITINGTTLSDKSTKDTFDKIPDFQLLYDEEQEAGRGVCYAYDTNILMCIFNDDNTISSIYTNVQCIDKAPIGASEQDLYDVFGFPYVRSINNDSNIALTYASTDQSKFVTFTMEDDKLLYTMIKF